VLEHGIERDQRMLAELLETMAKPGWSREVKDGFEELKVAIEKSIRLAQERIPVLNLDGPDD
jgi:hypothetical protein